MVIKKNEKEIFEIIYKALSFINGFPEDKRSIIKLAISEEINLNPWSYEVFKPYANKDFPFWYIGRYTREMVRHLRDIYRMKDAEIQEWELSSTNICSYSKEHTKMKGKKFPVGFFPLDKFGVPVLLHFGCTCLARPVLDFTNNEKVFYQEWPKEKYTVDCAKLWFQPKLKRDRKL